MRLSDMPNSGPNLWDLPHRDVAKISVQTINVKQIPSALKWFQLIFTPDSEIGNSAAFLAAPGSARVSPTLDFGNVGPYIYA